MADETVGEKRRDRLEFLDAARGIAALAVVLYHTLSGQWHWAAHWMKEKIDLGSFGVIVFFFISGFIIPVSLERKQLREFWHARAFRLLPAYWFALLLVLLCGALGLSQIPEVFHYWSLRRTLFTLTMLPAKPGEPLLLGVAWTLTLELFFYVVCSVLKITHLLMRRLLVAWAAVALFVILLVLAHLGLYPPIHFDSPWASLLVKPDFWGLLLAACVGSVFYDVAQQRLSYRVLLPLLPASVVVVLFGLHYLYSLQPAGTSPAISLWAFCLSWIVGPLFFVLMFCLRHLEWPPVLLWLGRTSYSLYLLHSLVFSILFSYLAPRAGRPLATATGIVAALIVADLSYRFIEMPGNSLGHTKKAVS